MLVLIQTCDGRAIYSACQEFAKSRNGHQRAGVVVSGGGMEPNRGVSGLSSWSLIQGCVWVEARCLADITAV